MNTKLIHWTCDAYPHFRDYTLILPSVSIGNVGQLAIDLLISTLPSKKIAVLHHWAMLPIVGYDPYNELSKEVFTAADLHLVEDQKLVLLQIRSGLQKNGGKDFIKNLSDWFKTYSFKTIVVLSSLNACERRDSELVGSQFRFISQNISDEELQHIRQLGHSELEYREDESSNKVRFFSGSGFVKPFMELCEVPIISFFKFVDEGDNTEDAVELLAYLNSWKKVKPHSLNWKIPFSWKDLYGRPPPDSIY